MKTSAVVDTSFWSAACHLGLETFLYELFIRPLVMPAQVIQEVFWQPPRKAQRVYPYQQRLKIALEDERITCRDPAEPYHRFGAGERACIGLAREEGLILLINDYRPYDEARRLGITVMSVPELVVTLAAAGIVAVKTAQGHMETLRDRTSDELVDVAIRVLGKIAD